MLCAYCACISPCSCTPPKPCKVCNKNRGWNFEIGVSVVRDNPPDNHPSSGHGGSDYRFWCNACGHHWHSPHRDAGNACEKCGASGDLYIWGVRDSEGGGSG